MTRVPVPAGAAEHPAVTWIGGKVVAGEGQDAMQFDPATKLTGMVTDDIAEHLTRSARLRETKRIKAKRIEATAGKVGGHEGIALE